MTTEQQLEQEIQDKGLTAPRLTPALIDSVIVADKYWQPEGTTLTVCVLTLANLTNVVGESACVSAANFDAEIGKKIAYENAREKVWALEGYLLRESLFGKSFPAVEDQPTQTLEQSEAALEEPLKVGDRVTSTANAMRPNVIGIVEVIRSHDSVGVRTDGGDLWHECACDWRKVA